MLGRWKIEAYLHRTSPGFYDSERVLNEMVNRADDPALRAVKDELIAILKAFQTASRDPWSHKSRYE
jgi:N-sulfoglucosamine sulfohydrolase